eukprot:gene50623-68864_t
MAEYRKPNMPGTRIRTRTVAPTPSAGAILPPLGQPHNMLARVTAIDANAPGEARFSRAADSEAAIANGTILAGPDTLGGNTILAAIRATGAKFDIVTGGGSESFTAPRLVAATGAHERLVPFPGWTTPGVIGLAAATILLKSQGMVPGRRTVVAGCGP